MKADLSQDLSLGSAGITGVLDANATSGGRIPPQSIDAEQSVLGAALLDNEAVNAILEVIRPEDFYQRAHQLIFHGMVQLSERHEPIDMVTLAAQLRANEELDQAGGVEYLSHLVDIVPTAANTQYYARIIKEMALRRRVIHQAGEIINDAFTERGDLDGFIDSVEARILKLSDERINKGFMRVGEIVKDSIKHVERLYVNKEPVTGVPTGFKDLDELTSGLQPSDLIIVAGRPSMGKTSLALSIASNVALSERNPRPVAVFSLEMSKEQLVMRLLCGEAKVSNTKVRTGRLGETDFPRLVDAASKISQAPMFIDETPAISVLELRAKARRLHREHNLALIVIDYLQLMRGSIRRPDLRTQEISEISGSLKALAKELSVPVVALSQLNRAVESRNDKRPMMADLRESGAIEQDADIIAFVYRDEVYNPESQDKGVAEIIIGKHRNGAVGTIRLAFQSEYTSFRDLADVDIGSDFLGGDLQLLGEEEELI